MMKIISNLIECHIVRKRNDEYEFLLLKRSSKEIYPGLWQMVTGRIEENEKAYETALRELKEETSLQPTSFWVVPYTNSFYSHENNFMCLVPIFVAEVENSSNVILSDEHCEYKWVKRNEAVKLLAWYGQRKAVELIEEYLINEKSTLEFIRISLD